MSEQTRLGCVSYLNTEPLVEGVDVLEGVELVRVVPSKLIGTLEAGQVDVALVSVIDAARASAAVTLLRCGMIGCDGPTLTVRLFSAVPPERITRVHADTDSHTSVELCRLLLRERYGVEAELVDYDARERMAVARRADEADGSGGDARPAEGEWPEAMLLIGDKVVTDSPPAVRYPHQLDLGEAWRELTGEPFVYAVWACLSERAGEAVVRRARDLLDRQRRHNRTRLDWIATNRAVEHRWPADLARKYLGEHLRYELDERSERGLRRFYRMVGQGEPVFDAS
ncbi:MAG: menaquinone biosynthesis protein [Planctomycetota bacterium]